MRSFVRTCLVVVLVAYALASVVAASSVLWTPQGTLGMTTDYGANVRSVSVGGPADRAGIIAGDRIDLPSTATDQRRDVVGIGGPPQIGDRVHFRLMHAGQPRDITLEATPAALDEGDRSTIILQCAASLVFIVVGAAMILIRPGPATWGFGLYCLTDLPAQSIPFRFASATATSAALFAFDIIENFGVVGLIVFALEFPKRIDTLWRTRLRRAVPFIFIAISLCTLYPDVSTLSFGVGAALENQALQILFGLIFLVVIGTLNDTYRRIPADGRERMRWVLLGFTAGLVTNYIGNTLIYSSLLRFSPPAWFAITLVSLNVLLPLTVAHAVIRHRVLDINLAISRALVYAMLTTLLAGLFGLMDWFFGTVLDEFRLSRLLEAAISVGIAFVFDRLRKTIEDFIETIFFRKRRAAEARVARLARELPQARTQHVIETVVVDEACDAFGLTSAALFLADAAGVFTRCASLGWTDDVCRMLDDNDVLVLSLRSRSRAVKLADLPWHRRDLPSGALVPVLAIPMYSRTTLDGIMLYGGHTLGGDIDAAERGLLEHLVEAARIALDALDAERLRTEHLEQQSAFDAMRVRLDELHHAMETQAQQLAIEPQPKGAAG